MDVLLMKHRKEGPVHRKSMSRFLQAAYWRLLHHAFLSGETESTSLQVRLYPHPPLVYNPTALIRVCQIGKDT